MPRKPLITIDTSQKTIWLLAIGTLIAAIPAGFATAALGRIPRAPHFFVMVLHWAFIGGSAACFLSFAFHAEREDERTYTERLFRRTGLAILGIGCFCGLYMFVYFWSGELLSRL